ncbi:HAD-IB family hydrolase [Occultella glacieicola]|uniref:HAD-IB family hydrolase n=1 Tax=Occultella glacieicola TaxID=2518684 RepID=A0ABY2E1N3_9MICO|nr:HAD-IB family hydrolase [Occultella glacieicola]TDE91694.1 HAD-IB family hydrolase [Occultella glacieicola]
MSADQPSEREATGAAAFFDVDNTIIRGASAYHLARRLFQRGFFRRRDIAFFGVHTVYYLTFGERLSHIDDLRGRALGLIKGHSVAEVAAIADEVYDEVLADRVFPGTRELIESHLAAGDQVWIITAGPRELGELVARRLGATGALATVAESKDGFYTGRLVGDMMHGEHKADGARRIADEQGLDLAASSAYGDSVNDAPLLSLVGHPFAINPDARLRRVAGERGWQVRDFRRRRRDVRRGVRTASWAGAVWVGAVATRAVVRRLRA